jgi:hypothetical protein
MSFLLKTIGVPLNSEFKISIISGRASDSDVFSIFSLQEIEIRITVREISLKYFMLNVF